MENDLRVLAMDAKEVILREKGACFDAHVPRSNVILDVEEARDHELFIKHALDRADTFHAEVTVQS